jgi:NIMA (never in mitosis gene a)-related kinase
VRIRALVSPTPHPRERVIHRDIKPANIYVTRERSVKIGDLGEQLARSRRPRAPQLTREHTKGLGRVLGELSKQVQTLVGTPFYMSPEQVDERGYRFESGETPGLASRAHASPASQVAHRS